MKTTRPIVRLLCIAMMLAFTVGWAQAGPLDLPSTPTATLNITVDGTLSLTVTNYRVVYVANPVEVKEGTGYTYDYQAMNIYVPSNATDASPIILQDNNGGWNGGKAGISVTDGANYNGTTDHQVGQALKAGYVIANVGCRSRLPGNNPDMVGITLPTPPPRLWTSKPPFATSATMTQPC